MQDGLQRTRYRMMPFGFQRFGSLFSKRFDNFRNLNH
jgi:hypothetical protein